MATDALFQQFLKQAKAKNPFEKSKHYDAYKTIDQLYREKRRKDGGVSVDNKYSRSRQELLDAYNSDIAAEVDKMIKNFGAQQSKSITQQKQQQAATVDATRKTALQQLNERNALLRQQANRELSKPPAPAIPVPSFDAIESVGSVGANADLAGANAARSTFFVSPDSAQSRYTITPPIGGGIGNRTKQSTDRLVGATDTLGTQRKDEF